jgi:hypothetical protein
MPNNRVTLSMHKKKDSTNIVQKEIEFKPKARAWQ